MSTKQKKPQGTPPTQMRLTQETKDDLDLIASTHALASRTDAVRYAARIVARQAKRISESDRNSD